MHAARSLHSVIVVTFLVGASCAGSIKAQDVASCRQHADDAARLRCYDAIAASENPEPPPTEKTRDQLAWEALDKNLAQTMIDPRSAIQYAVSPIVACKHIAHFNGDCLCFEVNGSNRSGGMTGKQMAVVTITGTATVANIIERRYMTIADQNACSAILLPRDSSLIHKAM